MKRQRWTGGTAWLRDNGYPVYVPDTGTVVRVPAPPPPTKAVTDLQRGDEVRTERGFESVAEVTKGADGRIRIVLAGVRLLGWFAPDARLVVRRAA